MKRVIALAVLLTLAIGATANAATFTVTRADDPAPGTCDPGDCSLREAVLAANAAGGDDTVALPASTHTLALGEIPVAANGLLTVAGAGAGETTIDGLGLSRVFQGAPNANLAISSVGVRGARATGSGGAVQMSSPGTLTITDSNFEGNSSVNGSGGAVQLNSPGTLVISRSSFTGNTAPLAEGGALQTNSDVTTTISDSTFSGNSSIGSGGRGGAIQVNGGLGQFTVTNSTFSDNRAGDQGGAIAFNTPKLVTLGNLTIANNTAAGATSSGGGIHANLPATITLRNTIIANNTASAGANCSSPFTTGGFNLESANSCGLGAGDLPNTDPLLGPLGDNGGPTATRALLSGSPAVDKGNPAAVGAAGACPSADQRGVPRPQGGPCDIGAYELAKCQGITVNRVGTSGADSLLGTGAADGFLLLGGNDKAKGSKGKDGICGDAGKDKLSGGPGPDLLSGGAGKDELLGQGGRDKLRGGGGKDRCVGGKGKDRGKSCERSRRIP